MITKRIQTMGIVAGVILLVALGVFSALLFLIFHEQEAVAAQAQARAAAENRSVQLSSLAELLIETEADRAQLTSYVLAEEGVIDFLALVEETGRGQGLVIETRSLDVRDISGSDQFEWLTLTVDATGSFAGVSQMASLIETLPYQVAVDSVSISRTGGGDGGQLWEGTFNIRVTKFTES